MFPRYTSNSSVMTDSDNLLHGVGLLNIHYNYIVLYGSKMKVKSHLVIVISSDVLNDIPYI